MVTGIPGHNKGKKFIKGVGYRYPKQPKKPRLMCSCGSPANIFYADGARLCFVCAALQDALQPVPFT